MNVLIVPEDFRKDQYILQPVIKRMMQEVDKPNANVRVCLDPLFGGVSEAMKWVRLCEVISMYPMVQLFLLLVGRDCMPGRKSAIDNLEKQSIALLNDGRIMLAENAWQEIEVWGLAGQTLPKDWNWKDIRADRDPKEHYFAIWAKDRKVENEPGEGRTTLGREAATNYKRLVSRCPEDIVTPQDRIKQWILR